MTKLLASLPPKRKRQIRALYVPSPTPASATAAFIRRRSRTVEATASELTAAQAARRKMSRRVNSFCVWGGRFMVGNSRGSERAARVRRKAAKGATLLLDRKLRRCNGQVNDAAGTDDRISRHGAALVVV